MPTGSFAVRYFCHNGGNHRPFIHSRIFLKSESLTNILGRNDYKRQVKSQYLQNIVKSPFPERIYTISSSSFRCMKYLTFSPQMEVNGKQHQLSAVSKQKPAEVKEYYFQCCA